jgi:metal transporter CNNM
LALDFTEMKVKSQSGTAKEKEYANKVLPIIKNHHLLLVSLMLWNASATEALPIFLNRLVSEYISIIISVTLVLLFGEIIPASILTGPNQLQIAANLTPLVYFVLFIFFPIAYPLSLLLDWLIGHDDGVTMYSRNEIVTMMKLQHEEAQKHETGERDTMNKDEVTIIGGALTFRDMKVASVMTSKTDIYMISVKETLSYKMIYDIFKAGYSRIPVYDKDENDIISLILAKDLIFVDPEDEIPISNFLDLFGRKPIFVWHDDKLGETLSTFRNERAHLALVRDVENEGDVSHFFH